MLRWVGGVQVGRLWTSLADYYIRRGMFEKARDIYEEGLTSGVTHAPLWMVVVVGGRHSRGCIPANS